MEIRVYDRNMNRLGTVENHTQLIWQRRFYEAGNFEIHAPITPDNLRMLAAGNIIWKNGSDEAGIIEDIENEESDVKNEITRKGRFLSSYFAFRLIKDTVNFNGTVENAMRQLVSGVTPIPLVTLGAAQGFAEKVEFQATMKNLQTTLTKLSKSSALGYRLRPDFKEKTLTFEVYKGVDRTLAQGDNPRVIFSESYENLNNVIYKFNNQTYYTYAVIGGEDTDTGRTYVEIGGGSGLDLREIFIDARDLRSEGLTADEYGEVLKQRGYERLAENVIAESFECETDANISFVYKKNYDLGDIVSVEKRNWNIKFNKRITELTEVYQYGGLFVVPTLGDALPETFDWGDD